MKGAFLTWILSLLVLICGPGCKKSESVSEPPGSQLLIFSKTQAYRHECIEPGIKAMQAYFSKYSITTMHSEDPAMFTDDQLIHFDAVMFFQTTGNVLDSFGKKAFMKFIQQGKGFVGVHSAADTEYDWPWFGELLGARFANHPGIQTGVVIKTDSFTIATSHLPERWTRTDEWYNFKQRPEQVRVELEADETTYTGGEHGDHHPLAWYHHFDGGRAYYTALGHTVENYQDTLFLEHLARAVLWAARK